MDHFYNKMYELYSPGKELSLDEIMMIWRGRFAIRPYLEGKMHKYGLKFSLLQNQMTLTYKLQITAIKKTY